VTLAVSNGNQQRGARLVKRAQSPVTQLAECEAVNFEVRGSSPRRRAKEYIYETRDGINFFIDR
jgi:hypothetical protein